MILYHGSNGDFENKYIDFSFASPLHRLFFFTIENSNGGI